MTLEELQSVLAEYPGQFSLSSTGSGSSVVVTQGNVSPDSAPENMVGVYDLKDENVTVEWVREDIESYLDARKK